MLAINMTALLIELLEENDPRLKIYIYKNCWRGIGYPIIKGQDSSIRFCLDIFGEVFQRMLLDFKDNFWHIKESSDYFKFSQVRDEYKKVLVDVGRSGVF